ncbi:unnamed protein product [Protopolystoma xenopodis]|uniref:Uncharacterized protein n=1 Tax=Protopolystoma xenopodis TaxID=117903 RepID=A0A3S5A4M3_9PLAT|nr:unnamed protein product [Protopolystoma xenopodis]
MVLISESNKAVCLVATSDCGFITTDISLEHGAEPLVSQDDSLSQPMPLIFGSSSYGIHSTWNPDVLRQSATMPALHVPDMNEEECDWEEKLERVSEGMRLIRGVQEDNISLASRKLSVLTSPPGSFASTSHADSLRLLGAHSASSSSGQTWGLKIIERAPSRNFLPDGCLEAEADAGFTTNKLEVKQWEPHVQRWSDFRKPGRLSQHQFHQQNRLHLKHRKQQVHIP